MAAGPDVLSLNRRRWEAQLRSQSQSRTAATSHGSAVATAPTLGDAPGAGIGIGAGGLSLPSRRSASTGGLIFWRGHPSRNGNGDADDPEVKGPGMYMPHRRRDRPNTWEWNKHPQFIRLTPGKLQGTPQPYNGRPSADMWAKAAHVSRDGKEFVNNDPEYLVRYGERDAFSLAVNDPNKYRIPNTSVVWKEGICRFPFCKWGFTPLTAAQWIWGLNALCFIVHFVHVFLTLHYAYWRHDMDATNPAHAERMLVRVYRITGIPTPEMIANNQSMNWDPLKRWTNDFYVRDNDMPINFATLTLSFFAVSAVAHLWACIVGAHERWWFIYWRQMDDGFCYWRWMEYSISASIMAMGIALSLGLREQNILACIFMLHWTTMWLGFLVEYVSVPKYHQDKTKYLTPIGRLQFEEFANYPGNKNEWTTQTNYRDYDKGANALKIINQVEWEVRTTTHAAPLSARTEPSPVCAQGDRPAADIRLAHQRTDDPNATDPELPPGQVADPKPVKVHRRFIHAQKTRNYIRCVARTRRRRLLAFIPRAPLRRQAHDPARHRLVPLHDRVGDHVPRAPAGARRPRGSQHREDSGVGLWRDHRHLFDLLRLCRRADALPVVRAGLLLQALAAQTDCLAT